MWPLPSDDPHFILLSVTGEFPLQRPVTRSFDVFFDLCLNKCLSKQSWGRWFEMLLRSLWHHGNVQKFQPMEAQLSMKAVLPLAKILATASCQSSKTGPWSLWATVISPVERRGTHYYRKISKIRRNESPNINVSHLVLQLSLPNPMKPGVESRMKM